LHPLHRDPNLNDMPAPAPSNAASAKALSNSQRRYLRGLCHHLHPVIMLGAKGVTDAVIEELRKALEHHELVKIKLSGGDRDERRAQIAALTEATGAETVQEIGHTASLFLRNEDEPKLALPR
jgi:RNA-binding protein